MYAAANTDADDALITQTKDQSKIQKCKKSEFAFIVKNLETSNESVKNKKLSISKSKEN